MAKVSVVVPVYNVYDYIDKCLWSLVNQTLDDIEIVVVNDGSPDNSQEIIDKYKEKYPNKVKSFIKKNGGLSDARNFGILKCTGEYIGFVDSDDYVEQDMFEKMYNKAKNGNFDVVVCDVNYVYPNKTVKVSSNLKTDITDSLKLKDSMINIYPAAWNKIYRREIISDVQFKKDVWYEDVEFLYRLFPFINSIGVLDLAFVNYVQRDGAITKTFDKRLYHYIDNWNGIVDFYKENNFYDEYFLQLEYCYVRYLYATFIIQATNFDKKEFNSAYRAAKENVKKIFPKYRRNRYFYCSLKGIYMVVFCKLLANLLYYFRKTKQRRVV